MNGSEGGACIEDGDNIFCRLRNELDRKFAPCGIRWAEPQVMRAKRISKKCEAGFVECAKRSCVCSDVLNDHVLACATILCI